jgi:hypothetical protein
LPKALEEPQGSAIAVAVLRCELQNFGQSSVPVDGIEQTVLERVDRANKISKLVRPVYQHRDAIRRQTFPNAHRPWQCNGNVVAPAIVDKIDRLALLGPIVAVGDEAVRDHCSAEELDGGVLQLGRAARLDARRAGCAPPTRIGRGRDGSNQPAPFPTGTVFSFRGGAFVIAEASYLPNQSKNSQGLPGAYRIGAWYHTSSHFADQRYDNTGLSLANPLSTGIPAEHAGDGASMA